MHAALRILVVSCTLLVAACSGLSLDGKTPRSLDFLNNDVSGLLLAFDLPAALEPVDGESILRLDLVSPDAGERHIAAVLVPATSGELAGTLPAPADQRSYYLFQLSADDQAQIAEAQAWGRSLPQGSVRLDASLSPRLCRIGEIDPDKLRISVLATLPGAASGLSPLIANQPLRELLKADATSNVPRCAGHSG
ncbi:hypothetical protein [Devosia sp.]|uniref:hypothetical protein n=1 Tax=Devosia sp. TaxID=1871048 RepID=UPI003A8D35DA